MIEGRDHPELIPELITAYAENAVEERPVAAMAQVREVDAETQRAVIELLNSPSEKPSNVPICVPFADGESGDILPVRPGVKGIALFLDHPTDEQLSNDGVESDSVGMDIEHAVFLPACFSTDGDDAPFHYQGDRVWEHPSGSRISMQDEDAIVTIEHPTGTSITLGGEVDEPEDYSDSALPESFYEDEDVHPDDYGSGLEPQLFGAEDYDNRTYPPENPGEGFTRFETVGGIHVTVSGRGVALGNDQTTDVTEVYAGQPNDPDRRELDGHHQHFHVLHHDDGGKSLVGPQLSFREFLAWMVDDTRQSELRNADAYAEARTYAENYLAWLEDEVGHGLDPTDPATWPDEEPMPTPSERDGFDPDT